ncbi:hypothetical protein PGQ11_010192 [Apiospora arundinis]|uniref:Uncharacterized protein n=1 Tax=Apiospora arundinis TaxID=335852 RepID=A0ABR2I8X5_9PEZI
MIILSGQISDPFNSIFILAETHKARRCTLCAPPARSITVWRRQDLSSPAPPPPPRAAGQAATPTAQRPVQTWWASRYRRFCHFNAHSSQEESKGFTLHPAEFNILEANDFCQQLLDTKAHTYDYIPSLHRLILSMSPPKAVHDEAARLLTDIILEASRVALTSRDPALSCQCPAPISCNPVPSVTDPISLDIIRIIEKDDTWGPVLDFHCEIIRQQNPAAAINFYLLDLHEDLPQEPIELRYGQIVQAVDEAIEYHLRRNKPEDITPLSESQTCA